MIVETRNILIILMLLVMGACSNDEYDIVNDSPLNSEDNIENVSYLKNRFSFALAKVLYENEDVRALIKEEALKQFDYEYDVLFQLVYDKPLAGGETLEKLLLKYLSKSELLSLLEKIPTLTIFVPSLPEDSFSAESWNIKSDIPFVAYKNEESQILYIEREGIIKKIRHDEIPVFPIVVVKPSERVVLQSAMVRSLPNATVLRAGNGKHFVFEYAEFDNKSKISTRSTPIPSNYEKIYDAKKKSDENGIWQRDYI